MAVCSFDGFDDARLMVCDDEPRLLRSPTRFLVPPPRPFDRAREERLQLIDAHSRLIKRIRRAILARDIRLARLYVAKRRTLPRWRPNLP